MKYKILVFGFTNNIGGVENFFMNYYRTLDFNKFQVDFISIYNDMVYRDEVSKNGNIYVVNNYNKHPLKYYSQILKIMKNNKYDIVHVNLLSCANILPLKAAKKAKVKHIIAHSHNANIPSGLLRRVLNNLNKNRLKKYVSDYFACSKLAGDWMFNNKEYTIINNKIDFNKFCFNAEKRKTIRNKYNIGDSLVIGHVGRFSQQKNHKFFVSLLLELIKKKIDVKLLLVGDGELKNEFLSEIKKNHLEDKVITVGMVNNTNDFYNAFDIFALPSLFEGLPLVGVEAQVNGVKCLFSSNITKELKISNSDQVEFIELDKDEWVKYIENCNKYRYNNTCDNNYNLLGDNLLLTSYIKLLKK